MWRRAKYDLSNLGLTPMSNRFMGGGSGITAEAAGSAAGLQPAYDDMAIRSFLKGFTTLHTEVAGIVIVNEEGEYISNEMYARSTKHLTDEDWYRQAVQSKGIFRIMAIRPGAIWRLMSITRTARWCRLSGQSLIRRRSGRRASS